MQELAVNLLNGISAGLLLFMLSAGLTLIFSMMGVLNFAHASFYMLGAYVAFQLSRWIGFWPALVVAPVAVGLLGAVFERTVLRRVHGSGHVAELLVTFGLAYVVLEFVQLVWGRSSVPFSAPPELQGAAFSIGGSQFPLTRAFAMVVSVAMAAGLWLLLTRTRIGLVVQAALTHPDMAQSLGHDVPRVFMGVFGGGCALAALAGVIGGITFITEPSMAAAVGSIVFVVVVVGGMGSLAGALVASLLIGLAQTLPVTVDGSLATLLQHAGLRADANTPGWPLLRITMAQAAPILPFLLLVVVLVVRPRGLLGQRDG